MDILKRVIVCDRTLSHIKQAISVEFVENKSKHIIMSDIGTPQGSVLSPLLANIVLHELDKHLEENVIPNYSRGNIRKINPEYNALSNIIYFRESASSLEREMALAKMLRIPIMDIKDPNYRRSMYLRYADDFFFFLFEGPIYEVNNIKFEIKNFLHNRLELELKDEKTVLTNISDGFSFLGANVKNLRYAGFRMKTRTVKGSIITLRANVRARVNMPTKTLVEKLIRNKYAHRNKFCQVLASPQTSLVNLDHATITQNYNIKIKGLLNYYSFAGNKIEIKNLI